MMQFDFQLNDREFKKSLRLNHAIAGGPWIGWFFVGACMIPSLLVFYFNDAGISLTWFAIMAVGLFLAAAAAAFRKPKFEIYKESIVLTDDHFSHDFSNSRSQIKWGLIDEIEETPDSFIINRLNRGTLIPKRVLGNQVDECREFFNRVKHATIESAPPVELFSAIFQCESPFPVYPLTYEQNDIDKAIKSKFQLVNDPNKASVQAKKSNSIWLPLFLIAILLLCLLSLADWRRPLVTSFIALAWLLPVIVLLISLRLLRMKKRSSDPIPTENWHVRLTTEGWAIGLEDGCAIFHWKDVVGIYESPDFFGFKTINHLLNLIPKRIFPDAVVSNRFLQQSVDLQLTALRQRDPVMATVVDTGNPFQPPHRQ